MSIGSFIGQLAAPLARKAAISLGFSVVTYAGISAAVTGALSASKGSFGGIVGEVSQLVAMAGFFEALSIIAAGITASVTLVALKKFEMR